jgi:hypothetical protein
MRILSAIIQVTALTVLDIRQKLALSHAIDLPINVTMPADGCVSPARRLDLDELASLARGEDEKLLPCQI